MEIETGQSQSELRNEKETKYKAVYSCELCARQNLPRYIPIVLQYCIISVTVILHLCKSLLTEWT